MHFLEFALKYLPVTVAEDNGKGNMMGGDDVQGRVQVLEPNEYTERNCQLFSSLGQLSTASKYTSMTGNGLGKDCTYSKGKQYGGGTKQHMVFAFNQVQCCNACVATDGCVGASFLTSDKDHTGGFGPQTWEGFGIHNPDVTSAKTTGGIPVSELEQHYRDRLGDFSSFDQFMDYSITFFTVDLQSYHDTFKKDNIPFLLAQWETSEKDTWYSLIFNVNRSAHVIELVSNKKPSGSSESLPQLEQRMSSQHCAKFKTYSAGPVPLLYISSINRAASNMTAIDNAYSDLFKATTTHHIVHYGIVERRCYNFTDSSPSTSGPSMNLDEDVCFTSRMPDPKKDKIFSVLDYEQMLWSEHAGTLGSNPSSMTDKYTDSHYALPVTSEGLENLATYFKAHSPYPITKDTRLAYACKQSYIIDPTGWSIQPIGMASWPNCGWSRSVIV